MVQIGAILPLTGPAATFGEQFRDGLQLGVDHVNAAGTVPNAQLELLVEDGKGDAAASVSAFQKLRTQGVKLFVTTMSGVALALVPLAERDQVLLFADASHPKITGQSDLVFRHQFTAEQEAELVAQHVTRTLKFRQIGILWVNDEFGQAWQETFKAKVATAGGRVDAFSFEKTENDFRTVVTKVLATKPQGVVVVGYGKGLGTALKRIREFKFSGPLITNAGLTLTPDAAAAAGDAANGVYHTDFQIDTTSEGYADFASEYRKRFNRDPSPQVLLEYNNVLLLAQMIKTHGSNPAQISSAIRKLGTFTGIGERMTITAKGDVLPELKMVQYGDR